VTREGAALPRLSIGIATGPVVTGQAPMKKSSPFVVVGEPVDQAVQLAAQAAAGNEPVQVLVSAASAAAVGDAGLTRLALDGAPTYSLQVR
jgi:class 3 adenylate cyclase